jgi:parvulin-like peptidyl-prolyl isomerase
MVVYHGPLYRRIMLNESPWEGSGSAAVVASVYGQPITRLMLEQQMRDHLWRRGEEWQKMPDNTRVQTRTLVLEQMINERLIHANRTMNGLKATPSASLSQTELQRFMQQFERDGGYETRRKLRHLSEVELLEQMRQANEDEAWVEEKIAARMDEVDEKAARVWFTEHADAVQMPERWHVAHVFLSGHNPVKDATGKVIGEADRAAEIKLLHQQLNTGMTSFADLAAKSSEDDRTKLIAGDLGWFSAARMSEDFMNVVRSLKVGQTSAPVQTKLGWHIIRVLDYKPAEKTTADGSREQLAEVLSLLKNQRREVAVRSLIAELRVAADQGPGFIRRYPSVIEAAIPRGSESL